MMPLSCLRSYATQTGKPMPFHALANGLYAKRAAHPAVQFLYSRGSDPELAGRTAFMKSRRLSQPGDGKVIRFWLFGMFLLGFLAMATTEIFAQEARQSPDDAWWTGSLVAYSARSLPQGHMLIEPYLW